MKQQSILISGGGVAGLILAHALSHLSLDITLVEPFPPKKAFKKQVAELDGRTAMILSRHVDWLRDINAWDKNMDDVTAGLSTMRIIDHSLPHETKAAPLDFIASHNGQKAFGYNTPLKTYRAFLWNKLPRKIKVLKEKPQSKYDLIIAADGRHSHIRDGVGITANFESSERCALTFIIQHPWAHHNISTELQTPEGPITLVPMPDPYQSSIVFTGISDKINKLYESGQDSIIQQLKSHLAAMDFQGEVSIISDIGKAPLDFMRVDRLYSNNVAITAEAAHVLHPMGAQGLNLSIGDMQLLSKLIAKAIDTGQSIASELHVLAPYEKARKQAHSVRHIGIQSSLKMLEHHGLTGKPRRFILSALRHNPKLASWISRLQS